MKIAVNYILQPAITNGISSDCVERLEHYFRQCLQLLIGLFVINNIGSTQTTVTYDQSTAAA